MKLDTTLFAAEAYVRKASDPHRAFEAAKHIYDLVVISEHPIVSRLMKTPEQMEYLLKIRMEEEQGRLDGIPGVLPKEFIFFTEAGQNEDVRKAYMTMQNQYVLRECDRIEFQHAAEVLRVIQNNLYENSAWID